MPAGGVRKGAGKPKGFKARHTLKAQEMRKRLVELFHDEADDIYKVLIHKAKEGDMPAIKEILERTLGKTPQAIETPDIKEALQIIFDDAFTYKTETDSTE